jgi:hypothetical protein
MSDHGPPPRWSSKTLDTRKAVAIARVLAAWERHPQMRLGELLLECLAANDFPVSSLYLIRDDTLVDLLDRFGVPK